MPRSFGIIPENAGVPLTWHSSWGELVKPVRFARAKLAHDGTAGKLPPATAKAFPQRRERRLHRRREAKSRL